MKHLFTIATFLLFLHPGYAQLEKTLHQTFDLEEAPNLTIDVAGDYVIETWASSYLMTETHVGLFGASPSIFKHLVEEELRYQLDPEYSEGKFTLTSHDKNREDIHTHFGAFTEIVKVKVFVPETYIATDDSNTVFLRKEDSLSKQ